MSKSGDAAEVVRQTQALVERAEKPCDYCDAHIVDVYRGAVALLQDALAEAVGYSTASQLLKETA